MTKVVVAVYNTARAAETAVADLEVAGSANDNGQAICERSGGGRRSSRGSPPADDPWGPGCNGYGG